MLPKLLLKRDTNNKNVYSLNLLFQALFAAFNPPKGEKKGPH